MSSSTIVPALQKTKDPNPVINVAGQERREAFSATGSLQKTGTSVIPIKDSHQCDTAKNDASNLQNDRTPNRATDILKNLIFALMTILSVSILVEQGSVCISK